MTENANTFSRERKNKISKEIISGKSTAIDVARDLQIEIPTLIQWTKEYLAAHPAEINHSRLNSKVQLVTTSEKSENPKQQEQWKSQPCWDCRHAVPSMENGCSWSRRFQPVPGWIAEKTMKGHCETYNILHCPLFDEG